MLLTAIFSLVYYVIFANLLDVYCKIEALVMAPSNKTYQYR